MSFLDALQTGFLVAPEAGQGQLSAIWPLLGLRRGMGVTETSTAACKVMIVDDEEFNVMIFRKYLQAAGFTNIRCTSDATAALPLLAESPPDILLLDVVMPGITGLEILERVCQDARFEHLPVLILTASNDESIRQRALELGATDFLTKPVSANELVPRVRNALLNKLYKDRLARHAGELEELVRQRTAELELSRREVVYCLARAAEFRDDITGHHVIRVGRYVGLIARRLGFSEGEISLLELAAQLHDIGKIGIPDSILRKPGKLTDEEFTFMKRHCAMGLQILESVDGHDRSRHAGGSELLTGPQHSPLLRLAGKIAATHHEKWDGSGYPRGLREEQIPIEGRMTAVADVFDSLNTVRPYKAAMPNEECFRILEEGRGRHFDPRMLDAFLESKSEILAIQQEFLDEPKPGGC